MTLPLNEVALTALKTFRDRGDGKGAVIRNEDGTPSYGQKHWFEKAIAKAQIENFTWHDLRHTFASRLRRAGVPLEDIAVLLDHTVRHSALGMTARYAHVHMPNLHSAVAKLCPSKLGDGHQPVTDTTTSTDVIAVMPPRIAHAG